MKKTITLLLALVLSLAACGEPEPENWRWAGEGKSSPSQLQRDNAECLNQGRMAAGVNRYVWASDVRRDCLIGRGWQPA